MKNPFRKLGAVFGKGRKGIGQTSAIPNEEASLSDAACAAGGPTEQLSASSGDRCQAWDVSSVPVVVVPDEEQEGSEERTDALATDGASVCGLQTPRLLTPTASPMHSDEECGAVAVQTVTATSTSDCQELSALNTCGDLERVLEANVLPVDLRSEIDNIRIEVLWQYPPFYDFCVIASDDDYNLSVHFRDYLARTYRLIGCTLYDGFITLGADLFDCYELMMDHSHKAFFLVTENFSQNAFCRRLQSGAVFQCLMSKVKKDREKCVPVYPFGICRAPLALSGVAGLLPAQKEMMKRVLLNTYLPEVRKRRALSDNDHYEKRCTEFKKRVNLCIEAYRSKNALEPSVPLLQVENIPQNSVASQGNNSENFSSNGNSLDSSDLSVANRTFINSLVPSISDTSKQNSYSNSILEIYQNSQGNSVSKKSDIMSSPEIYQLPIPGLNEELRKAPNQIEERRRVKPQEVGLGNKEKILVHGDARNASESVENEGYCQPQTSPSDREKKRSLPELIAEPVSTEKVKTKQLDELHLDETELKESESNTSESSDDTDENETKEEDDSSDNETSQLPKKICEALKGTNIGNSPGTTVVNIEGSTGSVTVGPSITVVVNFAQNEKKQSPQRRSPRRPAYESD